MLKPLEQWICDVCGDVIESPEQGYVIWRSDEQYSDFSFKVIHQKKCDISEFPSSAAVEDFLGEAGLNYLLSFLSIGRIKILLGQHSGGSIKDMHEFVDFFRRMQTPYYEEARTKFSNHDLLEWFSDSNEVYPYQTEVLKKIISGSY
ncbi:hypothetical protein SAMN02949497_3064 [Methylomagnum ishizawai]|uniref:Uncharacterized protein n=1 Tax=Methylomagnum ishizawai TaxID=1760988 RepID=A0A1Y6CZR3_9GAMM|nr:hypothetical protein [Methylomagnum ishizawai]SMF95690.1 hypothetical protein SAMN02949497_3064 [Methylomagnum ishizawai]